MTSRRDFMKILGTGLAALPFASGLLSFPKNARAADLPLAKEGEGMAKDLGYCADANKPNKHCPDRKAKAKKGEFCRGCQLYTKLHGDGKDEVGKCMIMPQNTVKGEGWCKSFVKRPS